MALEITLRNITSWYTGNTLWEGEAADTRDAIEKAVATDANLTGANLTDANLMDANLGGAKEVRLPTGELFADYLTDVVPALLTAGGKPLEDFAEHFTCHTWDNCPIAHAFDVTALDGVPILLRPRAQQFVELYDSGQISWDAIQAVIGKRKALAE